MLSPLTDIPTLETRLDLVELLLNSPEEADNIRRLLKQFPDLDRYGL